MLTSNKKVPKARSAVKAGFCFYMLLANLLVQSTPSTAVAEVFLSQSEALKHVFGKNHRAALKSKIIERQDLRKLEAKAKAKIGSRLFSYHIWRGNIVVIDKALVRTKQCVYMVAVNSNLKVKSVKVLAFFEPDEYLPTDNWFEKFSGLKPSRQVELGDNIPLVAGSTLTVNAISKGVRKNLALLDYFFN